jgi:predicted O-methyltransferase YrrM
LKSAWELGEPWWPVPAVRYLQGQLPERARVFEWGSGSSTIWFVRRDADIVAIESESEWHHRVSQQARGARVRLIEGTESGRVRSEPELRDRGKHFFDDYVEAIDEFPDSTFDVIVIDGIARCECAKRAAAKVRPHGLVVLDDTNWGDLFAPAFEYFPGWELKRVRGFKRPLEIEPSETTFFRRPG